jgi:GT2 family glycosyltransferase
VAIVLNYRTPRATVAAVRALQASQLRPCAVIVVDNASGDDSVAMFESEVADVHVRVSRINGGFSAGCNLGIDEALRLGAQRVLLVNSDVMVHPGALGALEAALDADPTLGIVGPIVVSSANSEGVVQSVGISYSRATGRMRHRGYGRQVAETPAFSRRDVDGVSGCAMLIRREVLERVGLLAEEYFFGFEDLDLCLRAWQAGFSSACIGTAVVVHEGSLSIGRASSGRIYFATRNHLLLARRFCSSRSHAWRAFQTAAVLGLNLVHVLTTSEVPRREGLRGFAEGARDYFAGRSGPRPDSTLSNQTRSGAE